MRDGDRCVSVPHPFYGLTGGAYLPAAIVTALNKEFLPVVKDMDPRETNKWTQVARSAGIKPQ